MSCDFKPGDEVIVVRFVEGGAKLTRGRDAVYVVSYVIGVVTEAGFQVGLVLEGENSGHPTKGYLASCFRKVERKTDKQSLTEWLSQPSGDTDHLDKPLPAKKRERA